MAFTHLHLHTEYSLLDGLIKIDDLIPKLQEYGMKSCAITDHGSLYGYYNFWTECKNNGIKPIIGSEVYVAKRGRKDRSVKLDKKSYHLVLIAKNKKGFQNLTKLVSLAQMEGFYYKPRVDRELLEEYSEGLIALSACLGGEVPSHLSLGKYEEAVKIAKYHQNLFGKENYFIEIQRNGLREQEAINPLLLKLAKEINAPIVATCDTHYIDKSDWKIQEVVWAISDGKLLSDETRRKSYGDQFYLKTTEEMEKLFSDLPEAIENTQKIVDMVEEYSINYERIQPRFWNRTDDDDPKEILKKITYEGAKRKYGETTDELKERINYELDLIHSKGYDDYFLVVGDIMQWAKRVGMTIGARGSVGGSVVAYCNDIINIEPIGWECYFERFLNPERPSPPDIDMDIQDDRRDELLNYVKGKYGAENFAAICAIGRMKTKAAIRDVSRVMNIDLQTADRLSKLVHTKMGKVKKINDMMKDDAEFANIINSSPQLIEMKNIVSKVEGIARHMSTHACGYLITPKPIIEYTPIQKVPRGGSGMLTQIEGFPLEEAGLMKFDFLGLRNLTIITNVIKNIEQTSGKKFTTEEIPLDDKATFETFTQAKTTGVFQFESDGMKKYLRELKPENVEDLCFMAAAYRPGPMKYIPDYIAIKHGQKKAEFLIPELKPILEKTNGFAIYQEQVIRIAVDIAGYSMGGADILRRAMGKKKIKIMKKEEPKFKKGVMKLGYDQEIADKIWNYLLPFADYGFNKAHAAGYAVIGYWTAYLKTHYPQEFIAGVLKSDIDDTDRMVIDMQEAESMGIQILPPNINKSFEYFTIEGDNCVRFGLAGLKGIGHEPIKEIVTARGDKPFKHLDDLLNRVNLKKVGKKALESLIMVGAMDEFGERNALLQLCTKLISAYQKQQDGRRAGQTGLFDIMSADTATNSITSAQMTQLPNTPPATNAEMLIWEKSLVGLYLTAHPLKDVLGYFEHRKLTTVKELLEFDESRRKYKVGGIITTSKKIITKKGDPMMFVTISDATGSIEGVIFPNTYKLLKDDIEVDVPIIIKGTVNERNDSKSMIVDFIQKVNLDTAKKYAVKEPKGITVKDYRYTEPAKYSAESKEQSVSNVPIQIELSIPRRTTKKQLQQVRQILIDNPGDIPVILFIPNGNNVPKKIKLAKGVKWNGKIQKLVKKFT